MSILEQVQGDVKTAMKAGEKERVAALRMIANALQVDAKDGKDGGDELAVLRRERKRRIEAADAYADAGHEDRAAGERAEAEIISSYLPAELGDDELRQIVDDAIAQTGAAGPGDMGKVMGVVMGKSGGRADGKRVQTVVRERLAGS